MCLKESSVVLVGPWTGVANWTKLIMKQKSDSVRNYIIPDKLYYSRGIKPTSSSPAARELTHSTIQPAVPNVVIKTENGLKEGGTLTSKCKEPKMRIHLLQKTRNTGAIWPFISANQKNQVRVIWAHLHICFMLR